MSAALSVLLSLAVAAGWLLLLVLLFAAHVALFIFLPRLPLLLLRAPTHAQQRRGRLDPPADDH